MKNNVWKLNSLKRFALLLVVLLLSSCGHKTGDSTMSSESSSPSSSPATSSSSLSSATASPAGEAKLSTEAQKLGVKPTDATTCPSNAQVKGKVTKKRGDIYHVPNSPDYDKVKPDICFADTATAEKAGFRAPKAQ